MKLRELSRSFQFRLGLLTGCSTAVIILISGLVSYLWFRDRSLWNIDQTLRVHASSILGSPRRPFAWRHIEEQVQQVYPSVEEDDVVFLCQSLDDTQFYRSRGWPKDLDPRTFLPNLKLISQWNEIRQYPNPRQRRPQGAPGDEAEFTPEQFGPVVTATEESQVTRQRHPGHRQNSPEDPIGFKSPGRPNHPDDTEIPIDQHPIDLKLQDHFDPVAGTQRLAQALVAVNTETFTSGSTMWRIAAFLDEQDALIIGRKLTAHQADLAQLRNAFLVGAPLALLLAFASSMLVARRGVKPISHMTTALEAVTAEGLNERLDVESAYSEFRDLIIGINQMLERLERSFDQARRFSGLAAHELKTPLTILQGKIDLALHGEEAGSGRQQFLAGLMEDVGRLKGVTERLLLLSRADAGHLDLHIGKVNISELLEEHAQDTELLAPSLKVETRIPENCIIEGDKTLINQVLQNLFSNAIRHNSGGEKAFIQVSLASIHKWIRIGISNSARPIPPEFHMRIFSRFQRGTNGNEPSADGAGLGLSLAREIVRAHGGTLQLKESTEQRTTFVVKLPCIPEPPASVSTSWRFINRPG